MFVWKVVLPSRCHSWSFIIHQCKNTWKIATNSTGEQVKKIRKIFYFNYTACETSRLERQLCIRSWNCFGAIVCNPRTIHSKHYYVTAILDPTANDFKSLVVLLGGHGRNITHIPILQEQGLQIACVLQLLPFLCTQKLQSRFFFRKIRKIRDGEPASRGPNAARLNTEYMSRILIFVMQARAQHRVKA